VRLPGFNPAFAKVLGGDFKYAKLVDSIQSSRFPPTVKALADKLELSESSVKKMLSALKKMARARADYSIRMLGLRYFAVFYEGARKLPSVFERALKAEVRTLNGVLRVYAVPRGWEEEFAEEHRKAFKGYKVKVVVGDEILTSRPSLQFYLREAPSLDPISAFRVAESHPLDEYSVQKLDLATLPRNPPFFTGFRDFIDLLILAAMEYNVLDLSAVIAKYTRLVNIRFPLRKYTTHKKHIEHLVFGNRVLATDTQATTLNILMLRAERRCGRDLLRVISHYLYASQALSGLPSDAEGGENLGAASVYNLALAYFTSGGIREIESIKSLIEDYCGSEESYLLLASPNRSSIRSFTLPLKLYSLSTKKWILS
jgi:DNA-binding Lrp family transcriptional regulator